jgi:nucleoside-diphosphate kinase
MPIEQTLSIIKPDGVRKNIIGEIYKRFEINGLRIVASKMMRLAREEAESFYHVHDGKAFFADLIEFMTSGPIMVQVLQGENAIAKNREIMGATDPRKAAIGTIRYDFATSVTENVVHGSDGSDTAKEEIEFFFSPIEIYNK